MQQQQQQSRRSTPTTQQRGQLNSTPGDTRDSLLSRVNNQNPPQFTTEQTLPLSSTSLMTSAQTTISTQTTQDKPTAQTLQSKSLPTFAETQLLSVYYLNRNLVDQSSESTNQDNCVFVEQQERQPIRFRATYDPSALTRSTQTSPPVALRQLSTHGSTLVVDANERLLDSTNQLYEQRLRIHSGSQRLANNSNFIEQSDELLSPSELVEESRYSYEEYIIHVDNNQEQKKQTSSSSPTSTSSVTTIIAQPSSPPPLPLPAPPPPPPLQPSSIVNSKKMQQPEELDSDRTSRLSGDEINTHSSTSSMSGSFTNQDWQTAMSTNGAPFVNIRQTTNNNNNNNNTSTTNETTRVSSWPPVPYDIAPVDTQFETSFILDESDEQRRPTRVQFAEQLVRVIPASATNSLSEESVPSQVVPEMRVYAPAIIPRTSTNRTNADQQLNMEIDDEDDETTTTTTTTTSSNVEQIAGRLQRTSGLTNLNEVVMARPNTAPPPPPPPAPPAVPPSTASSTTTTTTTSATVIPSGVDPRLVRDQLQRLDYQLVVDTRHAVNQSKWVKDHLDTRDAQQTPTPTTASGRVDALRSLFEQQSGRSSDSSTLNSPKAQNKRTEPEERPSRHGDEIRFRVKQPKTSTVQHAEPVKIIPRSKPTTNTSTAVAPLTWEDLLGVQTEQRQRQPQPLPPQPSKRMHTTVRAPFELADVQRIMGKGIRSIDDLGQYLPDGQTWKWNDVFWLSLTPSQRDQLRYLLQQSRSRQDSGDTQIYEHSDRSAYQGDSEDNTPKIDYANRRTVRPRNPSQEQVLPPIVNQISVNENQRIRTTSNDPGSTVSVTGAGAWQQTKQSTPTTSTGIGRYTETSTIHESQPSVSIFGSTPTATYTRIGSQESIASSTTPQQQQQQQPTVNKKSENAMTIAESGYSSADEPQQQQRSHQFRPNSSTIIEEPSTSHHVDTQSGIPGLVVSSGSLIISSNDIQLREQPIYENLRPENRQTANEPELDPASYEQFIYDYLSSHARRLRSDDGTLILFIDGQQIQMSHIRLPSSDNIALAKNIYLDAIDEYPPPFETESNQLVIFIQGESIVLPADRWLYYKRKYQNAEWITRLERVNRRIPIELMPIIEDWLSEHTTFLIDNNEMNVDGLNIPLTGKLGAHILDLYQIRQLQSNDNFYWNEILKYLIRTGYVSFDADEQIVRIAHSDLDARRILNQQTAPSPELIERLAQLLRSVNDIHFDNNNGTLILDNHFIIGHRYIADLFEKHEQGQNLNANELAVLLLRICDYEEDQDGQSLILTLDEQTIYLTPPVPPPPRSTSPSPPPIPVLPPSSSSEFVQEQEQEIEDEFEQIFIDWIARNARWSTDDTGREFLIRYTAMPNYLIRVTGQEGLHLSNLLRRQALQLNDILHWHENHVEIDQQENSLRMVIKPNNNIEIVNLPLEENEKNREKVNDERKKSTNEKLRSNLKVKEEEERRSGGGGEKNLVFFIPLHQQPQSESEQEEEEEEEEKEHSTSSQLVREEQKEIKTNYDNDDNADKERALLLESIASLLHFVNANGSNVGTLELIQGRRLRLTLTANSPFSSQQQHIEFDENDTKTLCQELDLDIDACSQHLLESIFTRIEFDSEKQYIYFYYRDQMLKLKNLKQKFFQPASKKLRLTGNKNSSSLNRTLSEDQVISLTQWLDQLNRQQLITITEQNDIVILPNGDDEQEQQQQQQQQQIFINHDDVDVYMENKINTSQPSDEPEIIGMHDIARILLQFDYIQYANGEFTFGQQRIALDRNELIWLRSIIRGVRSEADNRETAIDLFDGENTQVLHIPYEHMRPTNDPRIVADYLFQNGKVRYDVDTGNYAYSYVPPDIPLDDEDQSAERIGQRQLLSSHIRQIHTDEQNERIEIEFVHDPSNRLLLPTRWFRQAAQHNFDRSYIIDMLFANGGIIDRDTFIFNGRTYSLQIPRVPSASSSMANLQTIKLSSKQKQEIIENYVESINKQDGIKLDNTNNLLLLEDLNDGSQLYFTPEHTRNIQENQYRRQDVVRLLAKHSQIKQDEFGNWLLNYNNQYVQIPSSMIPSIINNKSNVIRSLGRRFTRPIQPNTIEEDNDAEFRARIAQETQAEFIERYHGTINYMCRNGFVTCNRRLKVVQIHFSNNTLAIPVEKLRSIIDTRTFNTGPENVLPFSSRQLSQWLLNTSDTISNTRQGYIQLTHRNKTYNFPLIDPNAHLDEQAEPASVLTAMVKRFGLTSRAQTILSRIDLTTPENQRRCANHLLERLDQDNGINIDNETRTLILSMPPDNQQQLVIQNPILPVTKQTLVDYLVRHGRFALNVEGNDIEYRHITDGRVYRFKSSIRDWDDALGETNEERTIRILGEILSLNGRFLQRADRQIIVSLRNGERFIIPGSIGSQLIGPVNGATVAELLVKYADDIYEEEDGKYLVITLADQTLRLQQHKQLMSTKQTATTTRTSSPSSNKTNVDPKLKLLFPFNRSLRQIQKTPSSSTLNVQPPTASNGYAIDPLLMLANYIYRAGSIYQDDIGRLVIKMNEDEIVVPRIEAINAIETINTAPHRTGTIIARLIDRIGKVQSNKAGGLIITVGRSSFELPKELFDRANQLHREAIDFENDIPIQNQDIVQTGLNGSMTLAGRHNRQPYGPPLLPMLRQSKSVGSLASSTVGHPWFTDDQQMLYSKDGRGDARYLNLDNYSLAWQKEQHNHGVGCEVRTIRNVAPYLDVLGYVENDPKKEVSINELTRLHPEMLNRGKMDENEYLTRLENERAQTQTNLCPKPRILVIPDDETMLSSDRKTRFYVQYMYENDAVLGADPAYVMMLPSRYPVRPTRPQLIAPHHYRDIALRGAPVYVHKKKGGEVYYENLAQYLSTEHPDLSSGTVRRMLNFGDPDEYLAYLSNKMPAADAERLVRESEEPSGEVPSRYVNVATRLGGGSRTNLVENEEEEDVDEDYDDQYNENDNRRRIVSPRTYYNTQNIYEDQQRPVIYQNAPGQAATTTINTSKFVERSPSTSSLGSDMLIANALPARRSVLGNASSNIPNSRNNTNRTTTNPLSSLTDENYGRPVVRGPI